jgi:hypothetical protein
MVTDKDKIMGLLELLEEDYFYNEEENSLTWSGNRKMFFDNDTGEVSSVEELK